MSDSLSPDDRNPLADHESRESEPTPKRGFGHEDLGNPEQGLKPTDASLTGEPRPTTPEHIHEQRLRGSGGATPEDSGNAPPELSGDDRSLLTGNPTTPTPE
jgi:hypothetical protein